MTAILEPVEAVAPLVSRVADQVSVVLSELGEHAPYQLDTRLLLRRTLLHLLRFSDTELAESGTIETEVARLAAKALISQRLVPCALQSRRAGDIDVRQSHLEVCDARITTAVHTAFHYLGSVRRDGVHLGLSAGPGLEGLLSVATFAPLDVPHLKNTLPDGIEPTQVLVLARLVAFEGAPRNTLSRTLRLAASWLRLRNPSIRFLLTYLDPNLGFSGSFYRAANWIPYAREMKRRYLYLDADYVTDRAMIANYGTAELGRLQRELGGRVTVSVRPLRPLDIYAYPIDAAARRALEAVEVRELIPPPEIARAR